MFMTGQTLGHFHEKGRDWKDDLDQKLQTRN